MRKALTILAVIGLVAPIASADLLTDPGIQIGYEGPSATGKANCWQGFWNNRRNSGTCWIRDWCDDDNLSDGQIAGYSRLEIQAAIDENIALYGTWDAYVLVTPVSWALPGPNYDPIIALFDVDNINWASTTMNVTNDGDGNQWACGATNYNSLEQLIKAEGQLVEDPPFASATYYDPVSGGYIKIRCDISEAMILEYLNNDSYDGFYATSAELDGNADGYNAVGTWGGHKSFLQLEIVPEPASLLLIGFGGVGLLLRKKR